MSKRLGSRPLTTADILKAKEVIDKSGRCLCGGKLGVSIALDPHRRIMDCPDCQQYISETPISDAEVVAWMKLTMAFDGEDYTDLSDAEVIDLLREAFSEAEREEA